MRLIVCFDIGGSWIKGALVESPDDLKLCQRIATPLRGFSDFVAALCSVIRQAETRPSCISISMAGVLDAQSGRAIVANIPCINGRLLKADLQAALEIPVFVANDADCFTLAEAVGGVGKAHDIVFGIILGSGVGGGLVVDQQLINPRGGYAGEWGHGSVVANRAGEPSVDIPQFACGCGLVGCVDASCSARGLERLHKHLHGSAMGAEGILAAWLAKDRSAERTVEIWLELIVPPLAGAINLTGASIVPVGGGLSNVAPLIERLDDAVQQRLLLQTDKPVVVPAQNRIEPGLVGAAILGLRANL